jgi:hypothetical protein
MTILRDTLYTDKILAVLREYSSNAWDAHRMVDKGTLPIKIVLPSLDTPMLTIRDFGPGMSPEEVFTIYTQYGESTKRDTDEAVGLMGIGSKSGFSYSDSFTVTSWNGGYKRVYVAVLDSTDIGEIQCLDEVQCNPDETGIEIQVPVRPNDITAFRTKASNLFQFFDPRPDINLTLPVIDKENRDNGFVSSGMHEWIALMGCIPYRLNLDQVQFELEEAGLWKPLSRIHGGLKFKIGEVNISASREELKYSDFTKKAIVAKFTAMFEEHIEKALKDIKDVGLSDWEKRIKSNFMTHVIGFKLPKGFTEWSRQSVELWGYEKVNLADGSIPETTDDVPTKDSAVITRERVSSPKTFNIFSSRNYNYAVSAIAVSQGNETRLIIVDDDRKIQGFQLGYYDYAVTPIPLDGGEKRDVSEVTTELEDYITSAHVKGIPVVTLSSLNLPWYKPYEYISSSSYAPAPKTRNKNIKHTTKAFTLRPTFQDVSGEHSVNWEVHTWAPADTDVYVALYSFVPKSFGSAGAFYTQVRQDKELAKWLNVPFPTIYGYKDTESSPLNMKKVKGTEYKEWRIKFFKDAVDASPAAKEALEHMAWLSVNGHTSTTYISKYWLDQLTKTCERTVKELGENHPFAKLTCRVAKACTAVQSITGHEFMIQHVFAIINPETEAKRVMKEMQSLYPLIFKFSDLFNMYDSLNDWITYIRTCDHAIQYEQTTNDIVGILLAMEPANGNGIPSITDDLVDDSVRLPLAEVA